jgi:hypothetical protein
LHPALLSRTQSEAWLFSRRRWRLVSLRQLKRFQAKRVFGKKTLQKKFGANSISTEKAPEIGKIRFFTTATLPKSNAVHELDENLVIGKPSRAMPQTSGVSFALQPPIRD